MGSYIGVYVVSAAAASMRDVGCRINRRRFVLHTVTGAFLLLALFIGFRDGVGVDDAMYREVFETVRGGRMPWRDIEWSYIALCRLAAALHLNHQAVFLFYALTSCFFLAKGMNILILHQNERLIAMSLFLSVVLLDAIVLMRQFLAMALVFYGLACYIRRKHLRMLLAFSLACLAHYTAAVAFVFLILYLMLRRCGFYFRLVTLMIAYGLQYIPVRGFVVNFLERFAFSNYYIKYYLLEKSSLSNTLGLVTTAYLLLYLVSLYFFERGKRSLSPEEFRMMHFVHMMTYFYFLTDMLLGQFGWIKRLSWYLIAFLPISLAYGIRSCKPDGRVLVKLFYYFVPLLLFAYTLLTYSTTSAGDNPFLPYGMNLRLWDA